VLARVPLPPSLPAFPHFCFLSLLPLAGATLSISLPPALDWGRGTRESRKTTTTREIALSKAFN